MGVETGSYSSFLLITPNSARNLFRNTPSGVFHFAYGEISRAQRISLSIESGANDRKKSAAPSERHFSICGPVL